jgi:hypothetical protein
MIYLNDSFQKYKFQFVEQAKPLTKGFGLLFSSHPQNRPVNACIKAVEL